jgi:P27 family predicted phage terminase small subunit
MPNPVPTLLKELRGTAQPCRVPALEPEAAGAPEVEAPAWMSELQRDLWRETMAAAPPNLLRRIDTAVLVQFVTAYSLYIEAAQEVNAGGYVTMRGGRRFVHPAVHVMSSQSVIMRQCTIELGFSPAARSRIELGAVDAAADSYWEQLPMNY